MLIAARYEARTMTLADIAQVAAIEHEAFPTSWPQTAYKRELANKLARYVVVTDGSRAAPESGPQMPRRSLLRFLHRDEEPQPTPDYIAGYVGLWLMVDEAHIVAIAVREAYRGRGLGELLLIRAIELATDSRVDNVTLEVRRSNLVAQALYEKYQFLKVGVRARYYSDNHEDAIIMSTPPVHSDSYRERLAWLKDRFEQKWSATEGER
jgi:[ribosomal protein S18]-alanine N-acetyltransferase